MEARGIRSETKLEELSNVSQKTINNIKHQRHDPYLGQIEKLAEALGIEPYQLLCPAPDDKFLALCLAWAQSDDRGRGDLHAIAEAVLKKRDGGDRKDERQQPSAHRRRG